MAMRKRLKQKWKKPRKPFENARKTDNSKFYHSTKWRKWTTLFQSAWVVILMTSIIFNHCANHAMHGNPQKNAINETKAD